MIRQATMNDAERVVYTAKLRDDLRNWLSEVRHYPAERDIIQAAIDVLTDYSSAPKY